MSTKKHINQGGINGTEEGVVNVNSKGFIALREAVKLHAQKHTPEQKVQYGLLSLRYQMERYISERTPDEVVGAGKFLKRHLDLINVKHKVFAKYIELEESNLSAIIKGRRKINADLAFKLGHTFNLRPDLWLLIQSKNELLKNDEAEKGKYNQFELGELLKRAS